jgi:hypothetical protein
MSHQELSMNQEDAQEAARRLDMALEMFGFGEALFRQNLRREHPEMSDAEIERALRDWLRTRPGALDGDCTGRRIRLEP